MPDSDESESDSDVVRRATPPPPCWQSAELLQGQREAWIVHDGQTYRLICTRNGKLILQK